MHQCSTDVVHPPRNCAAGRFIKVQREILNERREHGRSNANTMPAPDSEQRASAFWNKAQWRRFPVQ